MGLLELMPSQELVFLWPVGQIVQHHHQQGEWPFADHRDRGLPVAAYVVGPVVDVFDVELQEILRGRRATHTAASLVDRAAAMGPTPPLGIGPPGACAVVLQVR